jgi:hypothetical protein
MPVSRARLFGGSRFPSPDGVHGRAEWLTALVSPHRFDVKGRGNWLRLSLGLCQKSIYAAIRDSMGVKSHPIGV